MGFKNGRYAMVWEVENKGKWTQVRLSTSRKKQDDPNSYEEDFSGRVAFVGEAHTAASKLARKDRIKLGDVDVTTWYDKEKKIGGTNFKCFSFEPATGGSAPTKTTAAKAAEGDVDEADVLPF